MTWMQAAGNATFQQVRSTAKFAVLNSEILKVTKKLIVCLALR